MINGTFPDVDRVISNNDKVATLDTVYLAGLHRVAAACSRNDVGVRLTLTHSSSWLASIVCCGIGNGRHGRRL